MKKLYTFVPAVIFSAGVIIFISQSAPSSQRGESVSDVRASSPSHSSAKALHPSHGFGEGLREGESGESFGADLIQYELQRLRDPSTGKIPAGIRRLELEYAATLPGYLSASSFSNGRVGGEAASSVNWQSRGPWNVGGRTRAFAMDVTNANKLLAGSCAGGMWTSMDGGTSWAQNWGTAQQSVSCIAQDVRAGKTNIWYAGTGEGYGTSASAAGAFYLGNGMYKSTDGGQTWNSLASTVSNTPQTFDNVWDIIWNVSVNPADTVNNVVYAASYGAIWKTTNGGTLWTVVKGSAASSPFSYFTDVAVSPSGVVYATLSSDGLPAQKGIWRSPDGVTWTKISNTATNFPTTYGRIKIGISPSDENQVYFWAGVTTGFGTPDTNFLGDVEWNSLWKYDYDTAGGKWYDLSANLPTTGSPFDNQSVQGGYDMFVKVHPTDTAIVFLGGTNLYRSTDGFFSGTNTAHIGGYKSGNTNTTWAANAYRYLNHHPDQHDIFFLPSNPSTMFSLNDGGIYKTTDNMASTVAWTSLNNSYLTSMFYTVALDHATPNDSMIIGGTQDNGTWFVNSTNPISAWVQPHGGDGSYCAIANNKLSYYFSVQNGEIMKANLDAAGSIINFASIDPIGGKGYLFINPLILDPNNNNIMYLAGGKNLWRNDGLNTIPMIGNWDSISTGWTMFPDSVPTANAKITALTVSKNPANVLYYGTSNKRVYRIDNANTGTPSAVDITGAAFPGANVSCIAIDPLDSKKVMVAFSNYNVYSIFYTANADSTIPTWVKVAGNLEATVSGNNLNGTGNGSSVRWVSIVPVSDGVVYLAATSTGLYASDTLPLPSSTISPVAWTQQGAATIGNSICDMIDFRTSDGLVAVATHSRGIFTTNITSVNDILTAHGISRLPTFRLSNFPNPFSSSTTISFTLNKNQKVKLNVYDMSGRLIQTLADKEFPAGEHRMEFSGEGLSTGVYYCVFKSGEAIQTRKMILINSAPR